MYILDEPKEQRQVRPAKVQNMDTLRTRLFPEGPSFVGNRRDSKGASSYPSTHTFGLSFYLSSGMGEPLANLNTSSLSIHRLDNEFIHQIPDLAKSMSFHH